MKIAAIDLIYQERQRQIDVYGYTDEHIANSTEDYGEGDLAFAAAAYLMSNRWLTKDSWFIPELLFPWDMKYFKPSPDNRLKELSKAGAMILAEMDRILWDDEKTWGYLDLNNPPTPDVVYRWKHPYFGVVTGSSYFVKGEKEGEFDWWVMASNGKQEFPMKECTGYKDI